MVQIQIQKQLKNQKLSTVSAHTAHQKLITIVVQNKNLSKLFGVVITVPFFWQHKKFFIRICLTAHKPLTIRFIHVYETSFIYFVQYNTYAVEVRSLLGYIVLLREANPFMNIKYIFFFRWKILVLIPIWNWILYQLGIDNITVDSYTYRKCMRVIVYTTYTPMQEWHLLPIINYFDRKLIRTELEIDETYVYIFKTSVYLRS